MSGELTAASRLVAADQVYRAPAELTVYVVDVIRGHVIADIYRGTSRGQRVRLPRKTFQLLFSNYSA